MQYSAVILAFASVAAAVSSYTGSTITPKGPAPTGCSSNYPGTFELGVTKLSKRAENASHAVMITLTNGVLQDQDGRIGYIASNYQFQFDVNGQAGELYTAGFSVCPNMTLALGSTTVFWECLSGSFYNLYDRKWAAQCMPINLDVIAMSGSSATATATQGSDGQVGATTSGATPSGTATLSSISDHQVQGPTSTPSGTATLTSISDHQIQGPTSTPSGVMSTPVGPASGTAVITSISDHQIQGPTTTPPASTSVAPAPGTQIITSISDHQIQGPTGTPTVAPYTGAAAMPTAAAGLLLAAVGAVAALL